MKSKTLLTVPDLAAAVQPLVGRPISESELFRLIASGDVEPLGYVVRAPVFSPSQIATVVEIVRSQKRPIVQVQP
jgi:hypothetical protein